MSNKTNKVQCEGYRRYGGAFTLGPVKWVQCEENATVTLTAVQNSEVKKLQICIACWKEAIENDVAIIDAVPMGDV